MKHFYSGMNTMALTYFQTRFSLLSFVMAVFTHSPVVMAQEPSPSKILHKEARLQDVTSIDGLMKAYYEVVSGAANTPRDIARDKSLHHPNAQIFPLVHDKEGKPQLLVFNLESFHQWSKPVYDAGFYETEVKRKISSFGRTFHVWSTYETRSTPNGPVTGRGINNIQLYFDGTRYWILSETWDSERPNNPMSEP